MMFSRLLAAVAVALAATAVPALATPQPIDATDLWIVPDESGWGLNLYHQGDTLFGSLFVYGPDGQPKWYTASSLAPGPFVFSGALAEASGPWFGEPRFDPSRVTRRVVGAMTLTLGERDATVTYSVDGVQVSKRISRFSMKTINVGDAYYGVELQPAGAGGEVVKPDQHINLQDDGSTVTMDIGSNTTSSCFYRGKTRTQNGEMVSVTGDYLSCGGRSGTWAMTIDPTASGFTGNFSGNGIVDGRIAASRRTPPKPGNGSVNDLWFPLGESGWGVNIVEQGDTIFATLFVYDAQGKARWYSASEMLRGADASATTRTSWAGALYESTGPYFGTSFNSAAVTRRQVGTLQFSVDERFGAFVQFNVDGVQVARNVDRYAFRRNDLSGSYKGMLVMRSDDPRGVSYDDAEFTIDDRGDTVVMNMRILTGPTCTFTGSSQQSGSLRYMAGTHTCGAGGTFRMDKIQVTANGLTAEYQGPAGHISGFITNGNLSGARR